MKIGIGYHDKGYRGIFIRDEEGNVVEPSLQREDTTRTYYLHLSRKFGKFDVFASLSYHDNDSNDDYFLYKMMTATAGLGFRF